MSKLCIHLQLSGQLNQSFIGECVIVEDNGAQVRIRPQVGGQHTHRVVMDTSLCKVNLADVIVSD